MSQVIVAGLIPLVFVFPVPRPEWVTATLGLAVLVIEAIQQLNQDQQNWIAYRSTCEALKHEKYLYLAGAGPYADTGNENRIVLLADRIEGLISQEHAKWILHKRNPPQREVQVGVLLRSLMIPMDIAMRSLADRPDLVGFFKLFTRR